MASQTPRSLFVWSYFRVAIATNSSVAGAAPHPALALAGLPYVCLSGCRKVGAFVYPLITHLRMMARGPTKTSQADSVFATLVRANFHDDTRLSSYSSAPRHCLLLLE